MSSTRLTDSFRNRIIKAVLAHRFADVFATIAKDRAALARAVYEDVLTKKQRDLIATFPEGWLVSEDDIQVQFGAAYDRLYFSGFDWGAWVGEAPERVFMAMPAKYSGRCAKVYEATHKLSIRHDEIARRIATARSEIRIAENEIRAALAVVSTIPALVKAWPEVEPFCRDIAPAAVPLPAIPVAKLNETFGLPVAA